MKNFFNYVLASMLGTFLVLFVFFIINLVILGGIISSSGVFSEKETVVPENSVLILSFKNAVAEKASVKPDFGTLKFRKTLSLKSVTDAIKKAKTDDRIKGIYLDLSLLNTGFASTEELRNALKDFKSSGKFITAHSDLYTHKSYYLASVADKVYLTPGGILQFSGLSAQLVFFKSLLDKIGIEPQIIRHGKFKSAVEPFMSDEMSDANKEQTMRFISSLWGSLLKAVSEERHIPVAELNKYADELSAADAKDALKLNLVDGLKYEDQIIQELKQKTGISEDKSLNEINLTDYIASTKDIKEILENKENNIAVIYADGEIVDGEGTEEQAGSKTLSEAIRKAREDESVKAVVLRINSPGGSALASEVIWRETVLTGQNKPFMVSMGNLAASGGYYIACGADTIVAEPTTLTGSIGVFGILFNAKELMNKLGININTVNTNKYSDIGSPAKKLSDYERGIIKKAIEDVYSTFIAHVAEGRKISEDSVDAIGQGRIWSGEDALKIGLVDTLGGLETAINIAAEKAGLKTYGIKYYPEKDKFSLLLENMLNEAKTSLIKNELESAYPYYEKLKNVKNMSGIRAQIPYYLEIK
ncbi:MAG: signal peptide peptidase SppA [Chlorobi bacterium]|nr:signal peptide peptidase SppA [Chlorobiota bacterium]